MFPDSCVTYVPDRTIDHLWNASFLRSGVPFPRHRLGPAGADSAVAEMIRG